MRSILPASAAPFVFCLLTAIASGQAGAKSGSTPAGKPGEGVVPVKPALTIAVVDVEKAIKQTKSHRFAEEERSKMGATFQTRLKQMEDAVDKLRAEWQFMKDSPDRTEKAIELEALLARARAAKKRYEDEMGRAALEFQRKSYHEVQVAIEQLAKARGFVLVLRKRSALPAEADANEATRRRVDSERDVLRTVLYAAPSLDVTDDVIKLLKSAK